MSFLKGVSLLGVDVNRRSRGQLEVSRTVEEKRTAGRVEDSARSRGQRELLKRVVFIIYYKKVVLHLRIVSMFTI